MRRRSRPLRLVLFVGSLGGGGAQRHVSLLATRLPREDFQVVVACRAKRGEYLAEVEAAGVEVVEFRADAGLLAPRSLAASLRLARLLDSRDIDVLHSFLFECNIQGWIAGAASRRTRIVAGLRNMDDKYSPARLGAYVGVLRGFHRVVAVCRAVKRRFVERGVPAGMIDVVENGVSVLPRRGEEARAVASAALGRELPPGPLVVCLASLHPRKGLSHLVDAAAIVHRRHPSARFVVAGEGPEREALERRIRDRDLSAVVALPGAIQPVRELLSLADVFVLSSLEEGMSNALLEAHAEGVPAVVTDVGGNADVVEHGRTGYVVPPADPVALGEAVGRILGDPGLRQTMAAAARARVERRFTLDVMVERMADVYERVAADGE